MVQLGGNSVFAGLQLKFPLHYSDWITLTVPFLIAFDVGSVSSN